MDSAPSLSPSAGGVAGRGGGAQAQTVTGQFSNGSFLPATPPPESNEVPGHHNNKDKWAEFQPCQNQLH
eukprot:gene13654-biopygen2014